MVSAYDMIIWMIYNVIWYPLIPIFPHVGEQDMDMAVIKCFFTFQFGKFE